MNRVTELLWVWKFSIIKFEDVNKYILLYIIIYKYLYIKFSKKWLKHYPSPTDTNIIIKPLPSSGHTAKYMFEWWWILTDWWNNQRWDRESDKSPWRKGEWVWSWDDVGLCNFFMVDREQTAKESSNEEKYTIKGNLVGGRWKQLLKSTLTIYRFTISKTIIEIFCHKNIVCYSEKNTQERKWSLIHYIRVWNLSKSFMLFMHHMQSLPSLCSACISIFL